jgi:hypothetical protein
MASVLTGSIDLFNKAKEDKTILCCRAPVLPVDASTALVATRALAAHSPQAVLKLF